jgi:TPR repeat protein
LRKLHARAESGDADAQFNMGNLFFKGDEVVQDYAEAAKWYRLAALKGYAQAQLKTGMMYDAGVGVEQDYSEAVRWYRLAARQGLAGAQLNLGVAYAEGQGVSKDEAEAVKWFRLAANQGEAQAQFNLGLAYANGAGVTQDFVEAYRWARLAEAHGNKTAGALAQELTQQMAHTNKLAAADQRDMNGRHAPIDQGKPPADTAPDNAPIYVQIRAFESERLAEKFRTLLIAKLGDIGRPFSLFTKDELVRIQVGPYDNLSEARLSADRLKARLGIEPILQRH